MGTTNSKILRIAVVMGVIRDYARTLDSALVSGWANRYVIRGEKRGTIQNIDFQVLDYKGNEVQARDRSKRVSPTTESWGHTIGLEGPLCRRDNGSTYCTSNRDLYLAGLSHSVQGQH